MSRTTKYIGRGYSGSIWVNMGEGGGIRGSRGAGEVSIEMVVASNECPFYFRSLQV